MDRRMDLQLEALAHDLRTPMCCVAGAAQIALDAGRQGKDVSEQLRQILQAVHAMDGMLDQMTRPQEADAFTAEMLKEQLTAMCAQRAGVKQQCLSMDFSALGSKWYRLDYGALTRVLGNLIGNAIKYTQDGGVITVRAQLAEPLWKCGAKRIRFVVADNGMGMKREFMLSMYTAYARAKESAHLPGKGLGLCIARRLVRQMGGSIHVKSEWGKGTVFAVTIPVRESGMVH